MMDPPYYDDYYYWQWYPYWDRQQPGYNADGHTPSTSKDGHVSAPLCVPSDSDNSDSEMSPNAQDKNTTTGPTSENLTKVFKQVYSKGGLLLEKLCSLPPPFSF